MQAILIVHFLVVQYAWREGESNVMLHRCRSLTAGTWEAYVCLCGLRYLIEWMNLRNLGTVTF